MRLACLTKIFPENIFKGYVALLEYKPSVRINDSQIIFWRNIYYCNVEPNRVL